MKNLGIDMLLRKAQQMQEELSKVKQELAGMRVTSSAGGGMVEVTANGKQQIIDIKIEPEVFNSKDKEMLEDLVVAAVNQAIESSKDLANEEMGKVTGGVLSHLPEGFKIPGMNL